ncbi:MAG: DUF6429 family protein [Vicinamibacterales bacterium]
MLFGKGWIADPKGPAKSVVFADEGAGLAQGLLARHFRSDRPGRSPLKQDDRAILRPLP